jgi:opacity protein-like surface antigen
MRRTALIGLAAALAITVIAPGRAAAQMSITPFVGSSFGADAPATKLATGFAVTYMGRFAGVEAELGYTPDFYAEEAGTALVGDSNVTSFMGTALVGYGRARVKPYAALGAGLLRSRVTSGSALFDDVSTNSFGFNIGGGVTALLSEHVGLRGDIRYFRSLSDDEPDDNFDLNVGSFDFWRAYGGLTVSF